MPEGGIEKQGEDQNVLARWGATVNARGAVERTTAKGLPLSISAKGKGLGVEYVALTREGEPIARMFCERPHHGVAQVIDAQVYDTKGEDNRRKGIGTVMYDLIEQDLKAAGGRGLEPSWEHMIDDAIGFWKARRPDLAEELEERGRVREE